MINNTLLEIGAAVFVIAALAFALSPPNPRSKPEPPQEEQTPVVEFQAVPTIAAQPMTRQQKVDELENKLEAAEEDLAEIAKIIERLKAEEQAKKLDKTEQK